MKAIICDRCGKAESSAFAAEFTGPFHGVVRPQYYPTELQFYNACAVALRALMRDWIKRADPPGETPQ